MEMIRNGKALPRSEVRSNGEAVRGREKIRNGIEQ